jgi:sugar-specific transcriptional regulator TrmB
MKYEENLSEVGLNKWESRTYIALLELGSITTGPLIKKSEVPASKIYPVLESLNKKGFVSYIIKGKTKYFQAVEPEILKTLLKEKEKKIEQIIQELKQLQNFSSKKQKVEIFEGMKSITSLIINLIENSKKGEEWLSFSIGEDELIEKGETFWDKVGIARYEKGLNVKLLDNEIYKDKIREKYKERWKYISDIMRFGKTFFPTTTIIFQGKIIILDLLSEPETAVVIESQELLKFYNSFFMQQWKIATK